MEGGRGRGGGGGGGGYSMSFRLEIISYQLKEFMLPFGINEQNGLCYTGYDK